MLRLVSLTCTLALIAAACGTGAAPATSAAPTTASTAVTTATTSPLITSSTMGATVTSHAASTSTSPAWELSPARSGDPVVMIVSAGDEPRRALAFSFDASEAVTSEMTSTFRTVQVLNEFEPVESELTQTFTMETSVVDRLAEGWVVQATVLDVASQTTDPSLERTIEQLFAFLTGVTTYSLIAPDGMLVASDLRQMQAFLDASAQTVDLSAITEVQPRLPPEPVGVGAEWTVTATLEQETLAFEQVTTYEVVRRDGNLVTLEVTMQMTLLNPDSLAAGIEGGQVEFVAAGGGTMTLDLRSPVPVAAATTLTQDILISGDSDGEPISYTTRNEFGFTVVTP